MSERQSVHSELRKTPSTLLQLLLLVSSFIKTSRQVEALSSLVHELLPF